MKRWVVMSLGLLVALPTSAADLLIRGATVHVGDGSAALANTDVHVRDGRIAAMGSALAVAGATVIEAKGRPLTPGLFGGVTALGLEEVSLEPSTVDNAVGGAEPDLAAPWRPEFDVSVAFNPSSSVIPVSRVEGITFAAIAPNAAPGGSFVAGQGALIGLSGKLDSVLPASASLYIELGGSASPQAGGSRAAQFMMLEQAIGDARTSQDDERELLTRAGKAVFARYMQGGRVAFRVDRASDIVAVMKLSVKAGFKPIIVGGAEAWRVANRLAAAKVPVVLDPLVNLPSSFDRLAARLDNAALLEQAGVEVVFSHFGDATHNARKIRQLAGNAWAHGLSHAGALRAITDAPARVFGAKDRGRIALGKHADLVLWTGDPLALDSWPEQVWIEGEAQPMRSRQTELRDRYLNR
ncbi:amidohydrolase family protein [Pseudomarimonas arenosa]|uniref:Amidohydrolase family protein n=1 Tax=Pseudomarimonas arenosa TaxID=2774145 RepID=A0AAW3ZVJ4_9GAMM|nr:amidohydrolase family protein [Pseudomarimonas arenosa]MBD8528081.1 amidohydrolase family protein [Pseudomarimonas arenosa]